jgi:hypothetical protein
VPILPKQPDVYPGDLFDLPENGELGGPEAARWLVFYTLARREKDLMRKLEAAHIPFYGPMIRRRLRSAGGKTRSSYVPLFPGYVFSRVDDEQRRSALATNTIARWIPVGDERMLVDDLRAIRRLIDSEQPLTPEARLESGPRAERPAQGPRGRGDSPAWRGAVAGGGAVPESGRIDRTRRHRPRSDLKERKPE